MTFRRVAALAIFSALAVTTIAMAQAPEPTVSTVVFGNDVGFRIEGQRGHTPVGKLMVRIDGQWVEAALSNVAAPRIAVPLTEQPDLFPGLPGGRRP